MNLQTAKMGLKFILRFIIHRKLPANKHQLAYQNIKTNILSKEAQKHNVQKGRR